MPFSVFSFVSVVTATSKSMFDTCATPSFINIADPFSPCVIKGAMVAYSLTSFCVSLTADTISVNAVFINSFSSISLLFNINQVTWDRWDVCRNQQRSELHNHLIFLPLR